MKNKSNIALIIAACALVIGIAILGFVILFTGGVYSLNYTRGFKPNITHYSLFETNWSKNNQHANATLNSEESGEVEKGSKNLARFDEIDVATTSVDIHLIASDSYKVEYQLNNSEKIRTCDVTDGKLKIRTATKSTIGIFSFTSQNYINIYYDEKNPLEQADFLTTSGDITLDDSVKMEDDLNAATTSGDIRVTGGLFESAQINSTSGDITLNDNVKIEDDLSAATVSGDISLMGDFFKSVKLNSTSGNVSLKTTQSIDDYDYSLNTISGEKLLNWDNLLEKSNPSAKNKLTVNTVSGDIDLQFGIV